MNTPSFEFAKTDACKILEEHFPSFKCAISFTEVAFLYEQSESDCGGDDVEEEPIGFILRQIDVDHCVLFFREYDDVVFYGFFDDCSDAHDYGCDRLIMELYLSDFDDLADNFVPADFTASQQDSISVPASNPVEGQLIYSGVNSTSLKVYQKTDSPSDAEIRIELSTKSGDNSK